MNRELQLLILIDENERITQRELARATDLSLGTINNVLQKMINDELIELLQTEPRQVTYFLTEKGKELKSTQYYDEIKACYKTIAGFKKGIKTRILHTMNQGMSQFFLYGAEDDIYKLIRMCLIEIRQERTLTYERIDQVPKELSKNALILIWEGDKYDKKLIKQNRMLYLLS